MGNDIDDALDLAILHSLESRGEAKLLAVTLTKEDKWAPVYVDVVNHFYGRGAIPVGVVRDGKGPNTDSPMIRFPSERKKPDGSPLYPRKLNPGEAPDALMVLRRTLEAQPDQSVVIVQVGFSTNLGRLLKEPWGRDLAARKVKLLSMMAGAFPAGKPEFNVEKDIDAARTVFRDWPTPIVTSGFEIGLALLYPARSIEEDYTYVKDHPVADAYRAYKKMPYDRPTWDLTAALYAVRPERGYFKLSPPGTIAVDDQGRTSFTASDRGKHRYLIVTDAEKAAALATMVALASEPPSLPAGRASAAGAR
jgi:inosine-uridine nucleoside N-ribohydrolase